MKLPRHLNSGMLPLSAIIVISQVICVKKQDLSEVSEAVAKIKQLKPDIIVGGPPCQDFPALGKELKAKEPH